jgi:predicted DCC family thiol-disulfide oxidoreductase YuxK
MDRTATSTKPDRQNPPDQIADGRAILFFDGVCGLCNNAVDFILEHDRQGRFLFAPLQGRTAGTSLARTDVEDLNSMVLVTPEGTWRKSAAAVRILWRLGIGWRVLGCLLWLIPRPLRDTGYSMVAARRYRLFGQRETCRMPTPEERDRILP